MERLDLLGNQFHRAGFCKQMRKGRCDGDCDRCAFDWAVVIQQYGTSKAQRHYKSKKWNFEEMFRINTRL